MDEEETEADTDQHIRPNRLPDGPTQEFPHAVFVKVDPEASYGRMIDDDATMAKWLEEHIGARLDRWVDGYTEDWQYGVFFTNAGDAMAFKCWLRDGFYIPTESK